MTTEKKAVVKIEKIDWGNALVFFFLIFITVVDVLAVCTLPITIFDVPNTNLIQIKIMIIISCLAAIPFLYCASVILDQIIKIETYEVEYLNKGGKKT